jgi:ferritin-like metal-binding protein YciE
MDVMSKLRETFLEELSDLYDAEKQLTKALPKLAKAAEYDELKSAFEEHLVETQNHVNRIEQVFEIFGESAKGKKCRGMQGLLEEGEELIKEEEGDAAYIGGAQKVEHYEIAAYGTLRTWARHLGEEDAAKLLDETLEEEKAADQKLTSLAQETINMEDEGEEEEETTSRRDSK